MLFEALVLIGLIVLLLYGAHLYANSNNDFWQKRGVPWVDANKISSIYRRMFLLESLQDFDRKLYKSQPDSVKFFGYNEMRATVLYVKDLDLVRRIMVKDFEHFHDRRQFIKSDNNHDADPYMSRMVVSLSGQEWKDLRAIMSPTFSTGKIRRMFEYFNSCGKHLSDYLMRKHKNGDTSESGGSIINFQDCFGRYTMDVISSAAFGVPTDVFQDGESLFRQMAFRFNALSFKRLIGVVMYAILPRVARFLKLRISDDKSMNFFSKIVKQNIHLRRHHEGEKRQDFLQLLLEAQAGQLKADPTTDKLDDFEKDAIMTNGNNVPKKESAVVLDDTTLVSQCVLFFAAGADTIEGALTFAVYDLALNTEIQEKLAEEVTKAMDENDGNLTYDMVNQLEYLDKFLSESMRIHPLGFIAERMTTQDYTIPDTTVVVPKGTRVQIPIGSIQLDAKYYPDPMTFNPENFSAENKAKRHPYAYMPFGNGPRNCIAMRFAITEAKAAIAHLVYNFRVEPCEKTQIPLKLNKKNFKPENGMWLKFAPRR